MLNLGHCKRIWRNKGRDGKGRKERKTVKIITRKICPTFEGFFFYVFRSEKVSGEDEREIVQTTLQKMAT